MSICCSFFATRGSEKHRWNSGFMVDTPRQQTNFQPERKIPSFDISLETFMGDKSHQVIEDWNSARASVPKVANHSRSLRHFLIQATQSVFPQHAIVGNIISRNTSAHIILHNDQRGFDPHCSKHLSCYPVLLVQSGPLDRSNSAPQLFVFVKPEQNKLRWDARQPIWSMFEVGPRPNSHPCSQVHHPNISNQIANLPIKSSIKSHVCHITPERHPRHPVTAPAGPSCGSGNRSPRSLGLPALQPHSVPHVLHRGTRTVAGRWAPW